MHFQVLMPAPELEGRHAGLLPKDAVKCVHKFISPAAVRFDSSGELAESGTYACVEDRKLWVKN